MKHRAGSYADRVRKRIERGGADRLWTFSDFPGISLPALAAAMSRMTRSGDLQRVRKGVYYRPRPTVFGASQPSPDQVLAAVARQRKKNLVSSGMDQFNRLGLTTQVSGAVTATSDGPMRMQTISGIPVHVKLRPIGVQVGIRPEERTTLDVLRSVGTVPGTSAGEVVGRLKYLLSTGGLDFGRLAKFSRFEPPRVRALLGAIGDDLGIVDASGLQQTLNPLTSFNIRGDLGLKHAAHWRIRSVA